MRPVSADSGGSERLHETEASCHRIGSRRLLAAVMVMLVIMLQHGVTEVVVEVAVHAVNVIGIVLRVPPR